MLHDLCLVIFPLYIVSSLVKLFSHVLLIPIATDGTSRHTTTLKSPVCDLHLVFASSS